MKKLFIAVMAVATLASCAQEEIILNNKKAISFGDAHVANSTKAIDTTYGNGLTPLTKFNVYGTATGNEGTIDVFNGTEVSGEVGNEDWSYTGAQYWIANVNYKFVGVVDAEVVESTYVDLFPTQLTVTNEKDALVSQIETRNQGDIINDSAVNMQFEHLLSKVYFTFTDSAADDYTFKVSNVTIKSVGVSGTYTIATKVWDSVNSSDVVFGNVTGATADGATDAVVVLTTGTTSHYAKLIVPGTYENLVVTFDVELSYNDKPFKTWKETVTMPTAVTLKAGYSYNFTAELVAGMPIIFKVTKDPTWTDGDDVTVQ